MPLLISAHPRFCIANICQSSIQFNILCRLALPLFKEMYFRPIAQCIKKSQRVKIWGEERDRQASSL